MFVEFENRQWYNARLAHVITKYRDKEKWGVEIRYDVGGEYLEFFKSESEADAFIARIVEASGGGKSGHERVLRRIREHLCASQNYYERSAKLNEDATCLCYNVNRAIDMINTALEGEK